MPSKPMSSSRAGSFPLAVQTIVSDIAKQGATPLVVAEGPRVLGVIQLEGYREGRHP